MHPIRLAFDGVRCDYALFLARIAHDYWLESHDWDYLAYASRLARFALRVIASWGKLLIHEMGHTFLGLGHCEWDCCFDVAANAWLCKVRGWLGLPEDDDKPWYVPRAEKQGTDCGASWPPEEDGTDEEDERSWWIGYGMFYRCDVRRFGVAGQEARYCATGCGVIRSCVRTEEGVVCASAGCEFSEDSGGGGAGIHVRKGREDPELPEGPVRRMEP
jgi:hypothetical protein